MTATDWSGLIIASNEAAMQWYSLVTEKPLPSQPDQVVTPLPGGGRIQIGNSTILVLGVIVLAFVFLRK